MTVRTARLLAAVVVVLSALGQAAPAHAGPQVPALAYPTGNALVLATADGAALRRLPWAERFSLDGSVLATSVYDTVAETDTITVRSSVTGARTATVPDARAPVVVRDGRAVLFVSDRMAHRDRQNNSVWLRDLTTGTTRKLVQFANGPGLPGVQTGLDAVGPMQVVSDDAARYVAVAEGNDLDLFHYDVWLLDTQRGTLRRVTEGGRSRYPALSPLGRRLAVTRDRADCGTTGLRAADVVVTGTEGGAMRTLRPGSCTTTWTDLAWLDEQDLVAVRQRRTPDGSWRGELVSIALSDGAVRRLAPGEGVFVPVVSPELRRVAFLVDGQAGFRVLRPDGTVRRVPVGGVPDLRGSHVRR